MKNKKKMFVPFIVIAVIICAVVLIGYISRDYNSHIYNGDLYYFNESATSIVAETREIKYKDKHELVKNVLEQLMKSPENRKYQRIIEKKTKLLSVDDIDSGQVVVNFSREFITGNNTKDILAVYAVVKSLCAIGNVNSVKVIIEGKDISSADGSYIGYLSDSDINLSTDTYNSETREITLYFPEKDGEKLQRERRSIKVTDQQPIAHYIISELIKGTEDINLTRALNPSTVLLSVETSDRVCFVNFNSSFIDKNKGTPLQERLAVYAIVSSLTELDTIDRVQFLINGKRVDKFGGMEISEKISRDDSIIDK